LQYDVSDPFSPKKTGSVRIGGIANRTPHPKNPNQPLAGGPQMVEVSRDGNGSILRTRFTPRGTNVLSRRRGQLMVKLDAGRNGGIALDESFFIESSDYRFTRSASKAAIPRAIPIVFREGALAWLTLFGLGAFHGSIRRWMVVCCWTRIAGTEAHSSPSRSAADRSRHALSIGIIIAAVLLARLPCHHSL